MRQFQPRLTTIEIEELKPLASAFHRERVRSVKALEVFPKLEIKTALLINITPLMSLKKAKNYLQDPDIITWIMTLKRGFKGYRYNREGILIYDFAYPDEISQSYIQFFRNGVTELYTSEIIDPNKKRYLRADLVERVCVDIIERTRKQLLDKLSIIPPVVVDVTLTGLLNKAIKPIDKYEKPEINRFDNDTVEFNQTLFKNYTQDIAYELQPNFDILWQSSGWPKSPYFNDKGKWSGAVKKNR